MSLAFCAAFLLSVQFMPKITNYAVVVLAIAFLIASIICIATYQTSQTSILILEATLLGVLLAIILINVFRGFKSWKMYSLFLTYSTKVVYDKKSILLYIPIFWGILFAFIVIIVLEFTAFWSSGSLAFYPENLFYELEGPGPIVYTVLLAIQAIWGFSFIKSACTHLLKQLTSVFLARLSIGITRNKLDSSIHSNFS